MARLDPTPASAPPEPTRTPCPYFGWAWCEEHGAFHIPAPARSSAEEGTTTPGPFSETLARLSEHHDCPACENDGDPCAVCKPESGQWISNDELAELRASLDTVRAYLAAKDALHARDNMADFEDALRTYNTALDALRATCAG